ncbi:autism susceptibility gene 2 protein homolog isoform X11 [Sitodiplosis mosellana]|uniref:autism susceptibility gene 2 protein homolog isoform X11 n=1 Tax=Sitodiplosis mosellana TaxID=263140 RepID=UPI0024447489|nr:autism susceptibility gene 2 protein homolog isoform X11 [Sitodiplosis mosellana]
MEIDVRKRRNQRNKRRERAQRMQAERDRDSVDSAGSTTNVSNSGSGASRETGNGTSTPQNTLAPITNSTSSSATATATATPTAAVHDSADEDMATAPPIREKPPPRRKKQKEQSPLLEEDIVDGFAILAFKTYEDLEYAIKLATKLNEKRLSSITELTTLEDKPIKLLDTGQRDKDRDKDCEREWNHKQHNHITNNHHQQSVVNHTSHNSLTIANDPGTSDDSGRASERLTTSSVAPRDADSSRDRLSDASSRCSSGKGYICDSEGDDDKGSDGGSVVFASTPAQVATTAPSPTVPRKTDFPSTGLPHSNGPLTLGGSASPVSNATSQATTTATTPTSSQTPQMQVSNGPINSTSPISPSQTAPSALVKSIPAKVPSTSTSTSTSPGKPTQPQQLTSPTTHQHSQTQSQQTSPLVTLSNGFTPSTIPPIASTTHSTPLITSPISNQSTITNGTTQTSATQIIGSVSTQPPATLQAVAPAVHPSTENSTGRTNSPAVAPAANGTTNVTPVASNGGIPSYRYPGYPLYAPYGSFHHPSSYPVTAPIPPPTIPSPSASPRTVDTKPSRDYPHVRRISPNSDKSANSESSEKPAAPAPPLSSSLREQTSHSTSKSHSPRGHSPSRERDSYSSNVSSLSRTSTPNSGIAYAGPVCVSTGPSSVLPYNSSSSTIVSSAPASVAVTSSSLSYPKLTASSWPSANSAQLSPAITNTITKPTPPPGSIATAPSLHSTATTHSPFPPPLFATPLPPVSSSASVTSAAPHPFSAESLFQSSKADQADHLRRELDNRFLDRAGLSVVPSSPYLRQELHHHQHQHTHLHQHQHQQPNQLFPPPLFKDMPKFDSPFHRTGLGVTYPGYGPSILHPSGLGTPFVPPNHVTSFAPKQPQTHPAVESTKPKQVKPGRWNAMHVRIAWEILHHQKKENPEKTSNAPSLAKTTAAPTEMHRPPSHIFPSASVLQRPPELSNTFPPGLPARPYDTSGFLGGPTSHLGNAVSPFGRYASPFNNFPGLAFGRDIPIGAPPSLHDPWRNPLPRAVAGYPPAAWTFKPDPAIEALRLREAEEKERERKRREEEARREREEKERREKEKEERARKEQQEREQREQRERERERERREKERREMERIERERLLQQQRLSENSKMQRERSPLRNGTDSDVSRIKEEPKREEEMLMRGPPNVVPDPRYAHAQHLAAQHYMVGRHMMQGQMPPLGRGILTHPMAGPPLSHFGPPPSGWPTPGIDYRDPYRALDPMHQLRYAPGVMEAYRADEERAKAMYAAHLRAKEPSPIPAPPNRLNPAMKPSENAPAR